MSPTPPAARLIAAPGLDLGLTLTAMRMGVSDPSVAHRHDGSWSWALRTPEGPVTVQAAPRARGIRLRAWGPGSDWALERGSALIGAGDAPEPPEVDHPVVSDLLARFSGLRLVRSHGVLEAALSGVCRRGVSSFEASRTWRLMVDEWGDDAPGPVGLRLPPHPDRIASASPYELHVMGLEADRAAEVRRIASHRARLVDDGTEALHAVVARLREVPGVGSDVVEHVRAVALGDPGMVPLVDPHVEAAVVRVVGVAPDPGAPLASILGDFPGQQGRVVRVIEAASALRPGAISP